MTKDTMTNEELLEELTSAIGAMKKAGDPAYIPIMVLSSLCIQSNEVLINLNERLSSIERFLGTCSLFIPPNKETVN